MLIQESLEQFSNNVSIYLYPFQGSAHIPAKETIALYESIQKQKGLSRITSISGGGFKLRAQPTMFNAVAAAATVPVSLTSMIAL